MILKEHKYSIGYVNIQINWICVLCIPQMEHNFIYYLTRYSEIRSRKKNGNVERKIHRPSSSEEMWIAFEARFEL